MPEKIQKPGNSEEASNKTAPTEKSSSPIPSISLPKGGGAIRGIGEKFAANPVTGTGSLTIPIFTSPGRSGFGPQLSLSYDSGSGNGPFGFGWSLSLPSITRKTDKGLPKYLDAIESDVFVLSGAEDLVPMLVEENGKWVKKLIPDRKINNVTYRIDLYRPRIEGLFARIERWTSGDGNVHWRSISKDNILTVYGRDEQSRIFDPEDESKSRIFSWLICESYDDKGNAIVYEYKPEKEEGIDLSQANEFHRQGTANKYLKCIKYGNRKPLLLDSSVLPGFRRLHIPQPELGSEEWMFELVFDYEEGHYKELQHDNNPVKHQFVQASASTDGKWSCRPDPFSTYRAGFEVRTYRRCQRVLMFHCFEELFQKFPDLKKEPYLVRSTEFDYNDLDYSQPVDIETELKYKGSTRFASFIQKVTQSGYVRDESKPLSEINGARYLTYLKKSLPTLEFEYSQAIIQDEIGEIDSVSLENMPYGMDGARYQWVDLDGEGVSGILTEQAETWFYKPNLGGGKFDAMETVATKPSLASLNAGGTQLLDLAGDGQLDVVELGGAVAGFYERTCDQKWENFIPFSSLPNVSWKDPNLKFVDLTGDGHADVMITEDEVFTWYPSLAEEGFGPSEKVRQTLDEETGPRVVFDDSTQSIYLADFSGDGLSDLVRIRNGEVCYWPNLGYGRFGAKVTMDNAPWFDRPDIFDQKRIRLADVDGSGTTDIIYLGHSGASIYFNRSGNSWSTARKLISFPHIDNISSVQVADLFGNGTACLVWSSPLPGDSGRPMLYIDLMGGQKPHLLEKSKNNMGAETVVTYTASTSFYLKDKANGKSWITRIPFPVHVVETVETHDHISQNRFVTRYAYHHGYFDGIEREFRGFGMVEQWDTEEFDVASDSDEFPPATNIDEASHVPPVLTKTWFHTGLFLRGEEISRNLAYEYFGAPVPDSPEFETFLKTLLDDTVLPSVPLTADETREACRSLKGSILRQEVYAEDGSPKAGIPYSVSERNYNIELLQPRESNQHAVFFTHANETINYHYERNIQDPRIQHELVLEVDDFGNVERSVAIGYPRCEVPERQAEQKETHITLTVNRFINSPELPIKFRTRYFPEDPDWYRVGVPSETQTYEIVNPPEPTVSDTTVSLLKFKDIRTLTEDLFPIHLNEPDISKTLLYEMWNWRKDATTPSGQRLRLIERVRTIYRKNDMTELLLLDQVDSLALPGESYKLAFTPELLKKVFDTRTDDTIFKEGGYVHNQSDPNWWIPSGHIFYHSDPAASPSFELTEASAHFFVPRSLRDPFDQNTFVLYDNYDLLPLESEDPLKNKVTAGERSTSGAISPRIDYRVLQPYLMTDPNGNRTEVAFDALGMVAGVAVMGKEAEDIGDSLAGFKADITLSKIREFIVNPKDMASDLLKKATTRILYDIDRFQHCGQPPFAATLAREIHAKDLGGDSSPIQINFSYSDGFGREIQKKIQAESGNAPKRETDEILDGGDIKPGRLVLEDGMTKSMYTDHRWVGKGRTVFNNKGKPVKQYEPFFSSTHLYENEPEMTDTGVTPVLFYDPVERVICTLHPNNTYEKVVFDPWHQKSYDVNDTVMMDPRTDADISGYVKKYFSTQLSTWETWYQQRIGLSVGDSQRSAAEKAALHNDTPTTAHLDTLGRTFLTVAKNGKDTNGNYVLYETRIELDIEGNQRAVIDALDRTVMQYDYDMLSNRIKQESMDAGTRWMLGDVIGKPIYGWDSLDNRIRHAYDPLRRQTHLWVKHGNETEQLAEYSIYGEIHPDSNPSGGRDAQLELNLRGKIFLMLDGAGMIINCSKNPNSITDPLAKKLLAYDFKGNLLFSTRKCAKLYQKCPDWKDIEEGLNLEIEAQHDTTFIDPATLTAFLTDLGSLMEKDEFTGSTTYDALNRPVTLTAPDKSIIFPGYNKANLLDSISVKHRGAVNSKEFISNIDYNEKGQRVLIQYGNGAVTCYRYDRETFRLIHLHTRRDATFTEDCGGYPPNPRFFAPPKPPEGKPCGLQNIHYTYDPVGNITSIHDDAQQTIYHNGQVVRPDAKYTYDAIYRLIEACGREHMGSAAQPETTWNDEFRVNLEHPHDGQKMQNYFECYTYDEVGNILEFHHHIVGNGNWVRTYEYNEVSQIETGRKSNRLTLTTIRGADSNYLYDAHGNMTFMPHLPVMAWDFKDQLQMVDKKKCEDGSTGCKVYFTYDASGQRVRKVMEQNGKKLNERIYIGGFEVYRKYSGSNTILERESLHIMDDKQRVAIVDTKTIDTKKPGISLPETLIRYQYGNHLGSASLELDEFSEVISYEEYYPYGSTSYQARRSNMTNGVEVSSKRYRYTGKERDEETGLYYHGARYYAPWLGRWISCDKKISDAISNPYSFCGNMPINFLDPDGKEEKSWYEEGWETTKSGIVSAQKYVHEKSEALGETYLDWKMEKINQSDLSDDQKELERQLAVQDATVISTATEFVVSATVMAGPNLLMTPGAVMEAPKNLGEGASDVVEGYQSNDNAKVLSGVAKVSGAVAAVAGAVAVAGGGGKYAAGKLMKEKPTPAPVSEPEVQGAIRMTDQPLESRLFPSLTEAEVGSAVDNAIGGTLVELPGQNPKTGEGLLNHVPNATATNDPVARIAHADESMFKGIEDAGGKLVELRRHSADKEAPAGSYAASNPVTLVNTVKMTPQGTPKLSPKGNTYKDRYLDPNGKFIKPKTDAQWDSVHHH